MNDNTFATLEWSPLQSTYLQNKDVKVRKARHRQWKSISQGVEVIIAIQQLLS